MDWKCISAALALAASPGMAAETPIIFLSGWHDLTYARAACERVLSTDPSSTGAAECRSFPDVLGVGRALENKVITALAVEPMCHGATVLRDPHPTYDPGSASVQQANMALKDKNPHWHLHLDANPGSQVFHWTLFAYEAGSQSDIKALAIGEGTTEKAAQQICAVVFRRGANVRIR
jgi:hypothetical protein